MGYIIICMFLIVSTGYNCSNYVQQCYKSISSQHFKDFNCIIIDDGSTDNTSQILSNIHTDSRIKIYSYNTNMGAAYRRWQAINELSSLHDENVIILLGLDDYIMPNALIRIKEQYDLGKWMTYGNWVANNGYKLPQGFLYFSDEVHEKRSYRKDIYRSTGLNTFKKKLFNKLKEEDFKFKGEWIKATTESNLMFSCLEMSGKERIGVIEQPIVTYNRRTDSTVSRMGRNYQDIIYQDVISRNKKELYENIMP